MILKGLIAATYTPMHLDGSVNSDLIRPMFDYMCDTGVSGFYVCGSTGEGPSMTAEERKLVAEESVRAANGRGPVVIQVGSNSLAEAKDLAEHAASIGADAISAVPPFYFKPAGASDLVESTSVVASGAPDLPFYYYHIPRLSGVAVNMLEFLALGGERIPNLRGIKFSDFNLSDFRLCQEFDNGRYDILFGSDEMMLGAVAMGAKGAVGSSYGFAAPLWNKILTEYEVGDTDAARKSQTIATNFVHFLNTTPGPYPAVTKQVLWPELGFEIGSLRQPLPILNDEQVQHAHIDLRQSGFLDHIRK